MVPFRSPLLRSPQPSLLFPLFPPPLRLALDVDRRCMVKDPVENGYVYIDQLEIAVPRANGEAKFWGFTGKIASGQEEC